MKYPEDSVMIKEKYAAYSVIAILGFILAVNKQTGFGVMWIL